MVAISLYRGNLHRVPDVPRRWSMPNQKISLKDFKSLLSRRSRTLSRFKSSIASTSSPNPTLPDNSNQLQLTQPITQPQQIKVETEPITEPQEITTETQMVEIKREIELDGRDCGSTQVDLKPNRVDDTLDCEKKEELDNGDRNLEVENGVKTAEPAKSNNEEIGRDEDVSAGEKRRKEVEEKLQVLNEKKHNLVQVLKQILNVEEELKRRNSLQGMAARPSVPLQVDVTNDSGSMTRHLTPKIGSEGNPGGGDMEGAEAEDASNHNASSRYLHRTSSPSPSLESPLRRPPSIQHTALSHPARSSLGTTSSPSRFAPTGLQGHPMTVSLSGTNYIASSPSPAASGGTSAFRDARQPSPWN